MDPLFQAADTLLMAEIFGGRKAFDFRKMSPQFTSFPTVPHQAYTHLDITGQGFLVGLIPSTLTHWSLQIDGGPILELQASASEALPLLIPFTTSLKLTNAASPSLNVNAWAIVGKDAWYDCTLVSSAPTVASHYGTTVIDVSGAGVLSGLSNGAGATYFRVQSNGGAIYELATGAAWRYTGFLIPFAAGITVSSNTTLHNRAIYLLK